MVKVRSRVRAATSFPRGEGNCYYWILISRGNPSLADESVLVFTHPTLNSRPSFIDVVIHIHYKSTSKMTLSTPPYYCMFTMVQSNMEGTLKSQGIAKFRA